MTYSTNVSRVAVPPLTIARLPTFTDSSSAIHA